MRKIHLTNFLAKHQTTRASVAALAELGIHSTYWTVRRWRTDTGWPCGAMKQLLAAKGIIA